MSLYAYSFLFSQVFELDFLELLALDSGEKHGGALVFFQISGSGAPGTPSTPIDCFFLII